MQGKFIGAYEVEIPTRGVFGPGWTGAVDDELMSTGLFVEEPEAVEEAKEVKESKPRKNKDGE